MVKSALSSKDRSPPKNIADTSWPLRTPIIWRYDGGAERFNIDPWAVLEAQLKGDDYEIKRLLAPDVGEATEFYEETDAKPSAYWHLNMDAKPDDLWRDHHPRSSPELCISNGIGRSRESIVRK